MSGLFEALLDQAGRCPAAPAVVHASASPHLTTYGELLALAESYAGALATLTPPGTLLPIFANKSAHSIALSLGCLAAGRPFAWLSKRLRVPQIADIVSASRCEFIVIDASGLAALRSAIAGSADLSRIRWLGLADSTRAGCERALSDAVGRLPETANARTITPGRRSRRTSLEGIHAASLGCCLFTSGSTGRQKGVMVADGDLLDRARSEAQWYGLDKADRLLSILPLSFDVGLNQLMSALVAGACVVIQESWLPRDLVNVVAAEAVTGVSGVPAVWRDLLASGIPLDPGEPLRGLRYITVSGGSLSVTEQACLQGATNGVGIFKTYGQTETFRSASLKPDELRERPTSVGRAYPGTRVLVLDEAGRPCAPGELGEVVHLGLGTMMGYLGESSSMEKLRPLAAELGQGVAVFTGDYGFLDRDGYLVLKGRRDAMVKISGLRVYPEEVADQLRALDGIRDAEVVALDAAAADPQLVGFVAARDGMRLAGEAVRRATAQRLPAHMVPAQFVVLREIPRLPNGKPDRVALASAAQRRCENDH